jgi:hypothetical protein
VTTRRVIEPFPLDRVTSTSTDAAITVAYEAGAGTYTVTTFPAGDPPRTQTWTPADRSAAASSTQLAVYSKAGPGGPDTLTLSQPGSTGLLLYTYVGGGIWERVESSSARSFDSFVYGYPTANAATPRTGAGSYLVDLYGKVGGFSAYGTIRGMGQLDANFATGAITLAGDGAVEGRFLSFGGTGSIPSGASSLSGTLTISVTGGFITDNYRGTYTGPVNGSFYGPNAEELGATFRVVNSFGVNGSFNHANGWLLGRPLDTTSTTLQQLTSPRKLNGINAYQNWDVVTAGSPSLPTGSVQNGTGTAGTGATPYAYPTGEAYLVNGIAFLPPDKIPAESDARFTTFRVVQGNTTFTLRAYRPGPTNDQLVLSYVSFLDWQRSLPEAPACAGCTGIDNVGYSVVYGLRTDPTVLPRSGTATYNGLVFGRGAADGIGRSYSMTGTASLLAEFGSDRFSGSLVPVLTNTTSGNRFTAETLFLQGGNIPRVGPIDSGTNALISGIVTRPGDSRAEGDYSAAFFGPAAQEVGVAFTAKNITNPEASGAPITVSGGIIGTRN